jgi:hypothetical protein
LYAVQEQIAARPDICDVWLSHFHNSPGFRDFQGPDVSSRVNYIPMWYKYLIEDHHRVGNYSDRTLKKQKIAIGKRCIDFDLAKKHYQNQNWTIFEENWANHRYSDYYRSLSDTKYLIYLDPGNDSAGQMNAEAAIFGVISFGFEAKLFQRMLFPKFCLVSTTQEAIAKIYRLENDKELYDSIRKEIKSNLPLIHWDALPTMESLVSTLPDHCTNGLKQKYLLQNKTLI